MSLTCASLAKDWLVARNEARGRAITAHLPGPLAAIAAAYANPDPRVLALLMGFDMPMVAPTRPRYMCIARTQSSYMCHAISVAVAKTSDTIIASLPWYVVGNYGALELFAELIGEQPHPDVRRTIGNYLCSSASWSHDAFARCEEEADALMVGLLGALTAEVERRPPLAPKTESGAP